MTDNDTLLPPKKEYLSYTIKAHDVSLTLKTSSSSFVRELDIFKKLFSIKDFTL